MFTAFTTIMSSTIRDAGATVVTRPALVYRFLTDVLRDADSGAKRNDVVTPVGGTRC